MIAWFLENAEIILDDGRTLPVGSGKANAYNTFCNTHNLHNSKTIPIGKHMDGVPFQKKETVEVISWNFMAFPKLERVLFGLVEKQLLCKCGCHGRCTIDGMFIAFVWSLGCLFVGKNPSARHDGSDWTPKGNQANRHKSINGNYDSGFNGLL